MNSQVINNKKINVLGILCFTLFALVTLWGFASWNGTCLGDFVLTEIGLSAWSNGNNGVHYTHLYSIGMTAPAVILSFTNKGYRYAKALHLL